MNIKKGSRDSKVEISKEVRDELSLKADDNDEIPTSPISLVERKE